jgi:hypothetical protein
VLLDDAVIEAERRVVRECYRRLLSGETNVSALAVELNGRGDLTVTGARWSRGSLAVMLVRPAHAGIIMVDGVEYGRRRNFTPTVSEDEWRRLCALLAARRPGRPLGRVHVLSGLLRCECGYMMYGAPRPKGGARYWCRREPGKRSQACGRNYLDSAVALAVVGAAVKERLSDPRRARAMAERLATVGSQRAQLRAELAHLDTEADALAEKTRAWGAARVDKAMAPILARIEEIREELDALESPELAADIPADYAAQEWDRAFADGDIDALRMMVRTALPNLTIRRPNVRGDHSFARFDWDGTGAVNVPLAPTVRDAILGAVPDGPDGRTIADIAREAGRDDSTVSRWLARFEREGLVTRRESRTANNHRLFLFSRTPQN